MIPQTKRGRLGGKVPPNMVNTFLISSDFSSSAKILDNKRLFKQCVEAKQIINILVDVTESKTGFKSHPAVKQWTGYVNSLKDYYNCHLKEVFARGHWKTQMQLYEINGPIEHPWFVSCQQFHYSHMASLKRKNPEYYSFLSYPEKYNQHGYLWPSHMENKSIDIHKIDQYPLSILCHPPMKITNSAPCNAILKTGKKKGQRCTNRIKTGLFCGTHQSYVIINKIPLIKKYTINSKIPLVKKKLQY